MLLPEDGLHVAVEEVVLLPAADVPVEGPELLEAEGRVGPGVLLELLPLGEELLVRHPALVGDLLDEDLLHRHPLLMLGVAGSLSRVCVVPGLGGPHLSLALLLSAVLWSQSDWGRPR